MPPVPYGPGSSARMPVRTIALLTIGAVLATITMLSPVAAATANSALTAVPAVHCIQGKPDITNPGPGTPPFPIRRSCVRPGPDRVVPLYLR
jgi:hypothetical protein